MKTTHHHPLPVTAKTPHRLLAPLLLLPQLLLAVPGCLEEEADVLGEEDGQDDLSSELAASADRIPLPIEVLGKAKTAKTFHFALADTANVTHLYLRCNACGYDDIALNRGSKVKATVKLNGKSIPLKHFIEDGKADGNIKIIGGEASYGGIGGAFRTVRLMIPVNNLKKGDNEITFEHTDAVPPSIGFRILEMNLLRDGDLKKKVLGSSSFSEDNPLNWKPPLDGQAAIDRGEVLWKEGQLYDPWLDGLDGQGGRQGRLNGDLKASCGDCHASDGRDLKYFNFSNESIIQRSMFHGLSQDDGKKIASYIRSRKLPIVAKARPWNPTYQPGPGLDAKPVYEWAAGAGLEAILDKDSDMKPYLFPAGTGRADVKKVVDRNSTLNFRELPINIPMPEWNQWLPIIHPDDAFDTANRAITSDYKGNDVRDRYYNKLYLDAVKTPNAQTIGMLAFGLKEWLRRDQSCSTAGRTSGEPIRGLNGAVLSAMRLPLTIRVTQDNCLDIVDNDASLAKLENLEYAKRGLLAWASVKTWEVVHTSRLEEESRKQGKYSEPRGWVVSEESRNVFDRPPHFTGVGKGRKYFSQNELQGVFESNTWYHLNMILSPGYRKTMPSHFAYTYSHVELLQDKSKVDQGFRFWATMIKQRQLQTNGVYGAEAGLDLRTAQPYIYYGTARGKTNSDTQGSVGRELWRYLAQAMVEDFVADVKNATWADWDKNAKNNRELQDRNSTNFSACAQSGCEFLLDKNQGLNTYRVIPKLRGLGVTETALNGLIDWGKKTWAKGPWDRLRK
jgi:hypothetical protein